MQAGQYQEYLKLVAAELCSSKDRIRLLIGDQHWQTDGEHKEAILRRVIRSFIPEKLSLRRGFMVNEQGETPGQADILILDRLNKPILFQDGDLAIATPDCVKAIIEVKTAVRNRSELTSILKKLSDHIEFQEKHSDEKAFGGLFVYENSNIDHNQVLMSLNEAANGNPKRVISWVVIGSNLFFRFWPLGLCQHSSEGESFWHSYNLPELAQAYFISNVIWEVSGQGNNFFNVANTERIWFPLAEGKERKRLGYIGLINKDAKPSYWDNLF